MTYRLALKVEGPNPLYWTAVQDLIGIADIPVLPDSSYSPEGEIVATESGKGYARGFATAGWHWSVLTNEQRAVLREFCPGASAEVYIETATNEIDLAGDIVFLQALAIMHWKPGDEDLQADKTLGVDILFTHLIEV